MNDGVVQGEDGVRRCWWGDSAPEYRAYHDREWGFPVGVDERLFEKLSLEGFQAGLSWLTILRKREAFRRAFAGFEFERIARFDERDVERLLTDASIVRHRGKIEAVINNSRRAVELVAECGSLASYVWRFEPIDRPCKLDPAAVAGARSDARVAGARARSEAARVAVRRADDRLRVHAGDGGGERPSRRMRCPRGRGGGPSAVPPAGRMSGIADRAAHVVVSENWSRATSSTAPSRCSSSSACAVSMRGGCSPHLAARTRGRETTQPLGCGR